MNRAAQGFTLLELLIGASLMSVLLGLGLFVSVSSYKSVVRQSHSETLVTLLRSARSHASNNLYQSPWSVCRDETQYILFAGTTYESASHKLSVPIENTQVRGLPLCTAGASTFLQLSGESAPASIEIFEHGTSSRIIIYADGTITY
jgi:prepilin-type N-terminal cleavage/methylation domain-containing protein